MSNRVDTKPNISNTYFEQTVDNTMSYYGMNEYYGTLTVKNTGKMNSDSGYMINNVKILNVTNSNIKLGSCVMAGVSSGDFNIGIGRNALNLNEIGSNNIAIGDNSQSLSVHAQLNVSVGSNTLKNNVEGGLNSAFGYSALMSNICGCFNSAFGFNSQIYNQYGNHNQSLGYNSLASNTDGSNNIAIGSESLFCSKCSDNIAIGANSFRELESGIFNIGIGTDAMRDITDMQYGIGIGYCAGQCSSGNYNTFIGYRSGYCFNGNYHFLVGIQDEYSICSDMYHGVTDLAECAKSKIFNSSNYINAANGYKICDNYVLKTPFSKTNTILGVCSGDNLINTSEGNVFIGYGSGTGISSSNKLAISNNTTDTLIGGDFITGIVDIKKTIRLKGLDTINTNQYVLTSDSNGLIYKTDKNEFGGGGGGTSGSGISISFTTDGINMVYELTHNLNTLDYIVQLYEVYSDTTAEVKYATFQKNTKNTIQVVFGYVIESARQFKIYISTGGGGTSSKKLINLSNAKLSSAIVSTFNQSTNSFTVSQGTVPLDYVGKAAVVFTSGGLTSKAFKVKSITNNGTEVWLETNSNFSIASQGNTVDFIEYLDLTATDSINTLVVADISQSSQVVLLSAEHYGKIGCEIDLLAIKNNSTVENNGLYIVSADIPWSSHSEQSVVLFSSFDKATICYTSTQSIVHTSSITNTLNMIDGDLTNLVISPMFTIYKLALSANSTLQVRLPFLENGANTQDTLMNKMLTIELHINVTNNATLTYPSNISWINNEVPTLQNNKNNVIVLRTKDQAATWIGNLAYVE